MSSQGYFSHGAFYGKVTKFPRIVKIPYKKSEGVITTASLSIHHIMLTIKCYVTLFYLIYIKCLLFVCCCFYNSLSFILKH